MSDEGWKRPKDAEYTSIPVTVGDANKVATDGWDNMIAPGGGGGGWGGNGEGLVAAAGVSYGGGGGGGGSSSSYDKRSLRDKAFPLKQNRTGEKVAEYLPGSGLPAGRIVSPSNEMTPSVDDNFDEFEIEERGALAAIFEEAQDLHFKKRNDYARGGKDHGDDLGAAGQYADIHRKMGKIRRVLWDGKKLVGEPVREVLLDMIGHCVKAIRYLDTENMR